MFAHHNNAIIMIYIWMQDTFCVSCCYWMHTNIINHYYISYYLTKSPNRAISASQVAAPDELILATTYYTDADAGTQRQYMNIIPRLHG
jgi:hypothetical protein